ncbi:hypothetical protein NKG94_27410 [Micromonospora sp. M12]
MSLVMMRPDGGADLALDLRAELRVRWTGPATWGLLAGGVLLVVCAALLLLRPPRPREVIFVVEPDQVPVLAGRLGVTSLSGLGSGHRGSTSPLPAERQLTSVGSVAGSGPGRRSASNRRGRSPSPTWTSRSGRPSTGGDAESRLAAGRCGGDHRPAGGGSVDGGPAGGGGRDGERPRAADAESRPHRGSVLPERRLR